MITVLASGPLDRPVGAAVAIICVLVLVFCCALVARDDDPDT